MSVSAIVVVGEPPLGGEAGDEHLPAKAIDPAGTPLACVEVLGQSVVERTIQQLQRSPAVKNISVVTPDNLSVMGAKRAANQRGVKVVRQSLDCWRFSDVLSEQAKSGIEKILFIRLGAYVEFDFEKLLQFHVEASGPITRVHDHEGPLDLWMIDVNSTHSEAANFSGPSVLGLWSGTPYLCNGYVNRLKDARDLRRLVVDSFLGRCAIAPGGREEKPGVWIEEGVHVDRTARIVGPAYIGAQTKVRTSALITRFSNIEHHCEVGAGTAVKGSTVLPYTGLGRALCVAHSLVDGNRLTHLGRNVSVEIEDPKLLRRTVTMKPQPQEARHPALGLGRVPATGVVAGSLNFSEGEL